MEHNHVVYDSDVHFLIDPTTRKIRTETSRKTTVIQYDHNSERFTFDIPRYIEGHDMSKCDKVEMHYLNVDARTKDEKRGVYVSDDLAISEADENIVSCSWLISSNATQLVGTLNFIVRYCCVEGGIVTYAWNTAVANVAVSTGIDGGDFVATEYADVLETWKAELFNAGYINASTMRNDLSVLKSRMDTFASLKDGSTTGDAELQDLRVGADGKVYASAGEASRCQLDKKANLIDFNQMATLFGAEYGEIYSESVAEANLIGGYIHDSGDHPIYKLEGSEQYQLRRYSVKKGVSYRLYGYHSISNGFPILGYKTTPNFEDGVEVLLTQDNNNTFLDFNFTPEENGYLFFAVVTDLPIATMSESVNTIIGIKKDDNSVNKNIYCLGDSITHLDGSWAFRLADLIGANNVYNIARGGAMWKDWYNTIVYDRSCPIWNNGFVHIISDDGKTESYPSNGDMNCNAIPSNSDYCTISNEIRFMDRLISEFGRPSPDIIVIACGTNDTNESAKEYSDEEFENVVNTKLDAMTVDQKCTISGGIRWCIETLMSKYPNAEVMVATPIQSNFSSKKPYYKRINTWLKKFAEYYSVKVIDAYSECGITSAFEKDEDDANTTGRYLIDGIHPNASGNKLMADYYAKQIKHRTTK